MTKLLLSSQEYLAAFIKTAQYLAGLTTQQDIWSDLGQLLSSFFGADFVGFVEPLKDTGDIEPCRTFTGSLSAEELLNGEIREIIHDVLDSGFLAVKVITVPKPYSLVFLPLIQENKPRTVMLMGHETSDPVPKELLNVYLALAGLVSTTITRHSSEIELKKHRLHLEEIVTIRTKELSEANRELNHQIGERKRAFEALEEERRRLQQALDEVRTLRGIVPICAYCKKIRDDTGYWNQVEKYVSDHSDAKFSHGICPTCFEKEMKELKS